MKSPINCRFGNPKNVTNYIDTFVYEVSNARFQLLRYCMVVQNGYELNLTWYFTRIQRWNAMNEAMDIYYSQTSIYVLLALRTFNLHTTFFKCIIQYTYSNSIYVLRFTYSVLRTQIWYMYFQYIKQSTHIEFEYVKQSTYIKFEYVLRVILSFQFNLQLFWPFVLSKACWWVAVNSMLTLYWERKKTDDFNFTLQ